MLIEPVKLSTFKVDGITKPFGPWIKKKIIKTLKIITDVNIFYYKLLKII